MRTLVNPGLLTVGLIGLIGLIGLVEAAQADTPGLVALTELGSPYLGLGEPGLYPGGTNFPTGDHLTAGQALAAEVVPRDAAGAPAPDGWIGLVAVGMSNTNQEWARFERDAERAGRHRGRLVLVDAAQGGIDASIMQDPAAPYWSFFDGRLAASGLNPNQVQAIWLKQSLPGIPSPVFPADADTLRAHLRTIVGLLGARCPQLRLVLMSSRTYGGWGATGEPWAYQTAFAVKGVILDQINDVGGLGTGPWLGWGPYLWTNGATPRQDGFTWLVGDSEADHTHPSPSGETKVSSLLRAFFATDGRTAGWFGSRSDGALVAIEASDDTSLDLAAPDTVFGSAPELALAPGRVVYVKFSLTGLAGPVHRAKLSLLADPDASVRGFEVHSANSEDWTEATLTANNAPGHDPAILIDSAGGSRGAVLGVDVTAPVQAALAAGDPVLTLVLVPSPTGGSTGPLLSQEAGDGPRLVLTIDSALFADGFEAGNLARWSASTP